MDSYECIYIFSKHSENFHKCNNSDFYSVQMTSEGFVLVWKFGIIDKSPYSELYLPGGVQAMQVLIPRQAALIPPPTLVQNLSKDPLFSFLATDALSPPKLHLTTGHPYWDHMKGIPMDNAFRLEKAGKLLQRLQLYKEPAWCNPVQCKRSHLTRISNLEC